MVRIQREKVLLDTSTWIAIARGSVDELEDIVEHSELLISSLELPMIADHYVRHDRDPRPLLKYIEANAEIFGIDEQVIEHALQHGLSLDSESVLRALASMHDARLITVEHGRIAEIQAAEMEEGGQPREL